MLPNLTISPGAPVDRVVLDGDRATGVVLADGRRIEAGRVVLCAGSFGSPVVLLRSGIGPAAAHRLAGVGENLHDHATVRLRYEGSDLLARETDAFLARAPMPLGQSVVLARSSVADSAYDLHVFPHELELEDGGWGVKIPVAVMTPRSRGTVRLADGDPSSAPLIDHAYLADPADVTAIVDGIEFARRIAAARPVAALMGAELEPGPGVRGDDLRAWVHAEIASYYHPAGTCAMGPASDPRAVVGPDGSVHGLGALTVADASVMPSLPRANTNLPTAVVAERIVHHLIEGAA
jgi:choline dehydrogenase